MGKPWSPWNRQQKRVYHRVLSCLAYWQGHEFEVTWFMLSSQHVTGEAPSDEAIRSLTPHFERLRRMIERRFGFYGLEFLKVLTREGGGVIHGFMAYKVPNGAKRGSFFIPQRWLSAAWSRIHGARYVWLKKVGGDTGGPKRIARYLASQYLANQNALVGCSYSWGRTFGFPLVMVWRQFKRWCNFREWSVLCAGGEVVGRGGGVWSLASIRAGLAVFRRNEAGIFDEAGSGSSG
ncbi:MAG TPA: hypothetical protein VIK28_00890, partial [Sedimentisphaerales bacterium]